MRETGKVVVHRMVRGWFVVAAIAVMMALTVAVAAAAAPDQKDYFGTVVSVDENLLVITTSDDRQVDIPVSDETRIRLPSKPEADLTDLASGDLVAVSLEEDESGLLVAEVVFLIPEKSQYRHVTGEVLTLTDTEIVVQPLDLTAAALTFAWMPNTSIQLHDDAAPLAEGSLVVIVVERESDTDAASLEALEIHVKPAPEADEPETAEPTQDGQEANEQPQEGDTGTVVTVADEPVHKAEIRGSFQGIDDLTGNWLVDGTLVIVNANTVIEGGVVVGQLVEIEAILTSDGTPVALVIEAKKKGQETSQLTRFVGTFQGVSAESGAWLINGTPVTVDDSSDTDGLPYVGQRVKVKALLLEDGSLLAREIENIGERRDEEEDDDEDDRQPGDTESQDITPPTDDDDPEDSSPHIEVVKTEIEGILQSISGGTWLIGGIQVTLGPETTISGSPTIGGHVEVEAVYQSDGTLLALEIEAEDEEERRVPKKQAEIEGLIQDVHDGEDGTVIVVDGIAVIVTALTEVDGELQIDGYAKIEALFQNGHLVATEVKVKAPRTTATSTDRTPDADTNDSDADGASNDDPDDGDADGTSNDDTDDGDADGASNDDTDDGDVDGDTNDHDDDTTSTDADSSFEENKEEDEDEARTSTVEIKGTIDPGSIVEGSSQTTFTILGGAVTVVIGPDTKVKGRLEEGATVEVEGVLQGSGAILAEEVKIKNTAVEAARKIRVHGEVQGIETDGSSDPIAVLVNGQWYEFDPLTKQRGHVVLGAEATLTAVVVDGRHVIVEIKLEEVEDDDSDDEDDHSDSGSDAAPDHDDANSDNGSSSVGDGSDDEGDHSDNGSVAAPDHDDADSDNGSSSVGDGSDDEDDHSDSGSDAAPDHDDADSDNGSSSVGDGSDDEDDHSDSGSDAAPDHDDAEEGADNGSSLVGDGSDDEDDHSDSGSDAAPDHDDAEEGADNGSSLVGDGSDDEDDEDTSDETFLVDGIVTSLERNRGTGRLTGLTVDGEEFTVTNATEIEGNVQEGALVVIRAQRRGNKLVVIEIEVRREAEDHEDEDEPSNSDSGSDDDDEPEEFRAEGDVESVRLDDDGELISLVLNGTQFIVTNSTEVDGVVTAGAHVVIEGHETDPEYIAEFILVKEAAPTTVS